MNKYQGPGLQQADVKYLLKKNKLADIRITAVGSQAALLAKAENLHFTQPGTALTGHDSDKC